MPLAFKLLSQDKTFPLVSGYLIGRSQQCDIRLQDPNASGLHAKITENASGHLFIKDQGSANGLIVNKKPTLESLLFPGIKIQIGQSELEVIELSNEAWDKLLPSKNQKPHELFNLLKTFKNLENKPARNELTMLEQPFKLLCVSGLHLDEVWPIYFAPYVFGRIPIEGQLMGLKIPDKLFSLQNASSSPDSVARLQPESLESVCINDGEALQESQVIKLGDMIHIHQNERLLFSFGVLEL